jgi:hypothetical protein
MLFVEQVADNAFPVTDDQVTYFEKILLLRICDGQEILKKLFFSGHEERFLNISHSGPQRVLLELVVIHLRSPLFLARILVRIEFSITLFRLSLYWSKKVPVSDLPTYNNLTFLMLDYDKYTVIIRASFL